MAFVVNGFIRKHLNGKATLVFILDGLTNELEKYDDDTFIMSVVYFENGHPEIRMNGEAIEANGWYKVVHERNGGCVEDYNPKSYWGYKLSQLMTAPIWICKKVKEAFNF